MKNIITPRRSRRSRRKRRKRISRKHTNMNYKHFSKRNNFTRKIMGGALFGKLMPRFRRTVAEPAEHLPVINPPDVSTPPVMDLSPEELDIFNEYTVVAEDILYSTNNGEVELYWPTMTNVEVEFYKIIREFRNSDDISQLRAALQNILYILYKRLIFNDDITKTIPIDVRPSNTAELLDTQIPDYVVPRADRTPGQGIVVPVTDSLHDLRVWLAANLPY